MKEQIKIAFTIEAGMYAAGRLSWQYIDTADNLPEALLKYSNTQGLEFRTLLMEVQVNDGPVVKHYLFGPPEDQQAPVSRAIRFVRAVHRRLFGDDTAEYLPMAVIEQEISSKITELQRTRRVWQDIHARFHDHSLSWTEAFDALMSECGMPMEEALRTLAEHFDRRPVVTTTEV